LASLRLCPCRHCNTGGVALPLGQAMPCGPSPVMKMATDCTEVPILVESLQEGDGEVEDGAGSSSSMSWGSWESSSEASNDENPEFHFGQEGSDTSEEDTTEEGEAYVSGDRKRPRLAGAKDGYRSGHPLLPAASKQGAVSSEVTMIILDWDDTLLPSTWLQQQGLSIAVGSPLPDADQRATLKRLANCAIRALKKAKRLGLVTIITNGEKGWVELSCCKFFPELFPVLEGIKILSARSAYEPMHPGNPTQWKIVAFHKEISAFFLVAESGQKNMISIGDSLHERTALLDATDGRACWTKSMKFVERPSPFQLVKQLKLLSGCFRPFVDFNGCLDLYLQAQEN